MCVCVFVCEKWDARNRQIERERKRKKEEKVRGETRSEVKEVEKAIEALISRTEKTQHRATGIVHTERPRVRGLAVLVGVHLHQMRAGQSCKVTDKIECVQSGEAQQVRGIEVRENHKKTGCGRSELGKCEKRERE